MQGLISVIIMAAGRGQRFGSRKQFADFNSDTVAGASCALFSNVRDLDKIFFVYPPDMSSQDVLKKGRLKPSVELVKGGELREESVENALNSVDSKYVLIHDAARPLCPEGVIADVIEEMKKGGAAVPVLSPSCAVARGPAKSLVPIDRDNVYLIQTPQGYETDRIRKAYAQRKSRAYADSSAVAYEAGIDVSMVKGAKINLKITDRFDYEYLRLRMKNI